MDFADVCTQATANPVKKRPIKRCKSGIVTSGGFQFTVQRWSRNENRSLKRSHKLEGFGVERIKTFLPIPLRIQ